MKFPLFRSLLLSGLLLLSAFLSPVASALSILPVDYTVVSESGPQNGLVDPGETVTVSVTIFNSGLDATNNLVATLRSTAQLTSGSPAQSFGSVDVGDVATLTFTFTATGVAYQPVYFILDLNDNGATGDVTFDLRAQPPPIPARVGFSISSESFSPPNGLPDAGETVTVLLTLRNNGGSPTSNLTGTLQANVPVSAAGAPQNFGAIPPGGQVTRPYTFTVNGVPNTTYNLVLSLNDTGLNYGTVTFNGFRVARAAQVVIDSVALTSESAAPANGSPDPGEIVTANVTFRNVGESHANAVTARLLATGSVLAPLPTTAQSCGQIIGGGTVSRTFAFTGGAACGSELAATFELFDGASPLPSVVQRWLAGYPTQTFVNATPLSIPATGTSGSASPYPSVISVSGLTGNLARATVSLLGLAHGVTSDVDVLLVAPTGQTLVPMAATGGFNALVGAGVDLQFADAAASNLTTAPLASGTFKPTNLRGGSLAFPAPAPAGPYGSTLAGFNGLAPGGGWSLYVNDVSNPGTGALQRGWSLTLTTAVASCLDTSTNLGVALRAQTASAVAGQPFTVVGTISNQTPNSASGVQATFTLPAGAVYLGASASSGTLSFQSGVVTFRADTLAGLQQVPITLQFAPAGSGAQSLTATVSQLQTETQPADNTASLNFNVLVDSDGDGLPDAWETLYGFNPASPLDATLDADGDGQSNLAEFLAGTDPRSAASSLRIVSVVRDGAGCSVTFASAAGRSYRLERRAALESGAWSTVLNDVAGNGSALVVTDPTPPPGRQFYRVVLLP
ncbi:MAG: hypothetical protein JSR82_14625 [Verrucomicrobia bacterium]|nr:hypothetical protein [Verrucomicrobiota bacterium]